MRLYESGENGVEVYPAPETESSSNVSEIDAIAGWGKVDVDRDFPKISVVSCDSFECHSDPFDGTVEGPERQSFEFCRFREVD